VSQLPLTKEDWIDIRKISRWNGSLKVYHIAKFLDATPRELLTARKDYGSKYYKNIISVNFDAFLEEHGYKIVESFLATDENFNAVQKEDIEVSIKKYKRYITEGILLIEGKDHKVVLEMDDVFRREEEWALELYYAPKDEKKALNFLTDLEAYSKDHTYLRGAKIDPGLNFIPMNKEYTWDDVILPKSVKREVQLNVDGLLSKLDIYKKNKIAFKRGLILGGVPGTGKTLIGKVICQVANCTFLWVTPKFLTVPRSIARVCELARELSPTVLFLEDIDLYGKHREDNTDSAFLGEFMNQLDGLVENEYVIVIATTNKVDTVEDAVRNRPGRFDRILKLPKPQKAGRLKMLQLHLKSYNIKGIDLDAIASKTDEYTGAHVKELVNTALITAIDEGSLDKEDMVILKAEHFLDNIQKVKTKKISPVGFNTKKSYGLSEEPIDPLNFDDDDDF